VIAFVLDG